MAETKIKKAWKVTIPIAGHIEGIVYCDDQEDAFSAACEAYIDAPEDFHLEWEFHEVISEGNVLHVWHNEAKIERCPSEDEEE